jgi:aryl-alcohol dehydrogenase-like predicted oxidoreductase
LGEADERTDSLYAAAITRAMELGCNVLDSAINYRHQRSERVLGRALAASVREGKVTREAIVVATKGGYIAFDETVPADPRAYVHSQFIATGLATNGDIVDWNCVAPRYIDAQVEQSLRNLGLESIDVYYLHNPEAQLQKRSRPDFYKQLEETFTILEGKVATGKIRRYGTATWNGYRQVSTARDVLFLNDLVDIAERVGGPHHHFKVVQLPYNLAMMEALTQRNQQSGKTMVSFFEAAHEAGITVMASAPMLQGRLSHQLPAAIGEALSGLRSDAQRAIQFVRSTPGITTALVGMKSVAHVEHNLELATIAPAPFAQLERLFRSHVEQR